MKKQNPKSPMVSKPKTSVKDSPYLKWLLCGGILLITFLTFKPGLKNEFTNWDDPRYVTEDPIIKQEVAPNLKAFFSRDQMAQTGNYHPFTMISLAWEYGKVQLEPYLYHRDNLILHLLNVLLVFWFFILLTGKWEIASVTSLFFGIHPMHVESVAWVSERKDLLYSFFFLLSLCFYIWYQKLQYKSLISYAFCLLFFLCSLFSKGQATVLPLVLFLLDYLSKRKFNLRLVIEKIPFLILSLVFGLIALSSQSASGSLGGTENSVFERLGIASFNIFRYLYMAVLPTELMNFYSYPKEIPVYYYVAILLIAGLGYLFFWLHKKDKREVLFGFFFFLITISIVLQFQRVGDSIINDRYTYLPFIGLFFLGGCLVVWLRQNKKNLYVPSLLILSVLAATSSYASYNRCGIWKDSITLWTDLISKNPEYASAYNNRGSAYFNMHDYQNAEADFKKALELNPQNPEALANSANILCLNAKQFSEKGESDNAFNLLIQAEKNLLLCIQVKPNDPLNLNNLGNTLTEKGNIYSMKNDSVKAKATYNDAEKYILQSISLNNQNPDAWNNLGNVYFQESKLQSTVDAYKKTLEFNPLHPWAWNNLGQTYIRMGKYSEAVECLSKMIAINPTSYDTYFKRGYTYYQMNKNEEAVSDFSLVIRVLPQFSQAIYYRALAYSKINRKKEALNDVLKAKELGFQIDESFLNSLRK